MPRNLTRLKQLSKSTVSLLAKKNDVSVKSSERRSADQCNFAANCDLLQGGIVQGKTGKMHKVA